MRHFLSFSVAIATLVSHASTSSFDCMPGTECWPTSSQWQALNKTLDGNLKITQPWAKPCFTDPEGDACKTVQGGYLSAASRAPQYGTVENLKWEMCGKVGCELNSLDPTELASEQCALGRLSAYYVEALNTEHISTTLKFVKDNNIRLSIKNTGHDHLGRSTSPNSLALWTFNLKNLEYHESFELSNCSADSLSNIGVIGAGASASAAYQFFEEHSMHITVGAVGSVGVGGGFAMGGGHGM